MTHDPIMTYLDMFYIGADFEDLLEVTMAFVLIGVC